MQISFCICFVPLMLFSFIIIINYFIIFELIYLFLFSYSGLAGVGWREGEKMQTNALFFSYAEAFYFDEVPFAYSFLYVPCSRGHIGENIAVWNM